MQWKDSHGVALQAGDIIEDRDRRVIGEVIVRHGLPAMFEWKKFSAVTMGYEPVDLKAPNEAYIRGIIPRRTKLWYWRHGYVLDHIEVLRQRQPRKRRSNAIPLWK